MSQWLLPTPDTRTLQETRVCPCFLWGGGCVGIRYRLLRHFFYCFFRFFLCYFPCSCIRIITYFLCGFPGVCEKPRKFCVCSFSRSLYASIVPCVSLTHLSFCFSLNFYKFITFLLKNRLSASGSNHGWGLSLYIRSISRSSAACIFLLILLSSLLCSSSFLVNHISISISCMIAYHSHKVITCPASRIWPLPPEGCSQSPLLSTPRVHFPSISLYFLHISFVTVSLVFFL